MCYNIEGCNFFSLGAESQFLPSKWVGVCMGCIGPTDRLQNHKGFIAYELIEDCNEIASEQAVPDIFTRRLGLTGGVRGG